MRWNDVPRVSIALTSYNCAPYLAQAIESILGQTFADLELLISDDCSSDNSAAIASSFAEQDRRVRFFRQPRNLGLIDNYNFLFGEAKGELVGIQDADDWSDPRRLEKQISVFRDQAIAVCGTAGVFVYSEGQSKETGVEASRAVNGILEPFPSLPASAVFPRRELDRLGGWRTFFEGGTSMDRYFLMELLDGKRGWHIGEPLYFARVRPSSNHRSWTPRKMVTHHLFLALHDERRRTGTDALREQRLDKLGMIEEGLKRDRALIAESMRESAVLQIDCGQLRGGASLLARAITKWPFSTMVWRTFAYLLRSAFRSFLRA